MTISRCPHCGDPGEFAVHVDEQHEAMCSVRFYVACSDTIGCGARGPLVADEDDAIQAWNRVSDAAGLDPMVQWAQNLVASMNDAS